MEQIFISYRRDDSEDATARINDWFDMYFGPGVMFRDIDSLRAGRRFPEDIETALASCKVAIVVIGSQWATIGSDGGVPRILHEGDYVRMEIGRLMQRNVPILPVCLNSAKMPRADQLPPELRGFETIGATNLRTGRDFPVHVRFLAELVSSAGNIDFQDYPAALRSFREIGLVSASVGLLSTDAEVLNQIHTAKELMIVMNDGRGFLDSQQEAIRARALNPEKHTRVVFLHPDSNYIRLDAFLSRVDKDLQGQASDIARGYRALRDGISDSSSIEIRGSHEIFPNTYVVTENFAFMSPYLCRKSGVLPIFRFAADDRNQRGFYARVRKDAEHVFDLAKPLKASDFVNTQ